MKNIFFRISFLILIMTHFCNAGNISDEIQTYLINQTPSLQFKLIDSLSRFGDKSQFPIILEKFISNLSKKFCLNNEKFSSDEINKIWELVNNELKKNYDRDQADIKSRIEFIKSVTPSFLNEFNDQKTDAQKISLIFNFELEMFQLYTGFSNDLTQMKIKELLKELRSLIEKTTQELTQNNEYQNNFLQSTSPQKHVNFLQNNVEYEYLNWKLKYIPHKYLAQLSPDLIQKYFKKPNFIKLSDFLQGNELKLIVGCSKISTNNHRGFVTDKIRTYLVNETPPLELKLIRSFNKWKDKSHFHMILEKFISNISKKFCTDDQNFSSDEVCEIWDFVDNEMKKSQENEQNKMKSSIEFIKSEVPSFLTQFNSLTSVTQKILLTFNFELEMFQIYSSFYNNLTQIQMETLLKTLRSLIEETIQELTQNNQWKSKLPQLTPSQVLVHSLYNDIKWEGFNWKPKYISYKHLEKLPVTLTSEFIQEHFEKSGFIKLSDFVTATQPKLILGCGRTENDHDHSQEDSIDPLIDRGPTVLGFFGSNFPSNNKKIYSIFTFPENHYQTILDEGPISYTEGVWKEVERILKPGGIFIAHLNGQPNHQPIPENSSLRFHSVIGLNEYKIKNYMKLDENSSLDELPWWVKLTHYKNPIVTVLMKPLEDGTLRESIDQSDMPKNYILTEQERIK